MLNKGDNAFKSIMIGAFKFFESFFSSTARNAHVKSKDKSVSEEERKQLSQMEREAKMLQRKAQGELRKLEKE